MSKGKNGQLDRRSFKSVTVAFSLPDSQHFIAWNSALLQINLPLRVYDHFIDGHVGIFVAALEK